VVSLYAREMVEDLECRRAAGDETVDPEIERLGLDFQIATRLTSWVAVSEEPTVDPTRPYRRERIPHALPAGLSVEGLGLRRATGSPFIHDAANACAMQPAVAAMSAMEMSPRALLKEPPAFRRLDSQQKRVARDQGRPGGRGPGSGREDDALASGARIQPRTEQPERRLTGRVLRRLGRELTVEIEVGDSIEWRPLGAHLLWSDGPAVGAAIVLERTTRPGSIGRGRAIRLSLLLERDGPARAPDLIVVAGIPGGMTVDLRTG
jgi:Ca-activated chloride channel family protein